MTRLLMTVTTWETEKAPIKPLSLEPMLISDSKTWNVQLQELKKLPKFLRVSTCISVLYCSGTGNRHGLYVHRHNTQSVYSFSSTYTVHVTCMKICNGLFQLIGVHPHRGVN